MKLDGRSCFNIGLTAFALYLSIQFWPAVTEFAGLLLSAVMPLLIGCVIAYLVNILMSFYEKHYFVTPLPPVGRTSYREMAANKTHKQIKPTVLSLDSTAGLVIASAQI